MERPNSAPRASAPQTRAAAGDVERCLRILSEPRGHQSHGRRRRLLCQEGRTGRLRHGASRWVYDTLRRFRAGIEAEISLLTRVFGLARRVRKGDTGFRAYLRTSVLAGRRQRRTATPNRSRRPASRDTSPRRLVSTTFEGRNHLRHAATPPRCRFRTDTSFVAACGRTRVCRNVSDWRDHVRVR